MIIKNTILSLKLGFEAKRKRLCQGAVPSQFPWKQPDTPTAQSRKQRAQKRQKDMESKDLPGIFVPDDYVIGAEEETSTIETQETSVNANADTQTEAVSTNEACSQTISRPPYSLDAFASDNAGIHFYTGLENYLKVCFVLSTLGAAQHNLTYMYGTIKSMDVKDQFFLVLMKLRRYLTNFRAEQNV